MAVLIPTYFIGSNALMQIKVPRAACGVWRVMHRYHTVPISSLKYVIIPNM